MQLNERKQSIGCGVMCLYLPVAARPICLLEASKGLIRARRAV